MIELIQSIFAEGDYIKIFFSNSNKSVEGYIFKLLPTSIAIKTQDGKICGVKGEDIDSFEEGVLGKSNVETETIETSKEVNPIVENVVQPVEENTSNNVKIVESESSKQEYLGTVYKVGDVIPMDKLHEIDPDLKRKNKIPNSQRKQKEKLKTLGTDLSALHSLVKKDHEMDDMNLIPALGEVKVFFKEKKYGFISDSITGKEIYFSLCQVIDNIDDIVKGYKTPVVYSIQNYKQGLIAVSIHRPKMIADMIKLSEVMINRGEYRHAFHIVEQILTSYPDNFSAYNKKKQLERLYPQYSVSKKKNSDAYSKAKSYHDSKNYEKAIEFYIKAINDDGEKVESSIKDLGMLYTFLYKQTEDELVAEEYRLKAKELMIKYVDDLSKSISTLNYLENFYYSIKEFENLIKIVDILVERREILDDKFKYSMLLYKKAYALVQMNEMQEAVEVIEESLSIDVANQASIKLKNLIDSTSDSEELLAKISATDFDSHNACISTFVQQTLDNYDEYAGVPPKIIESGIFNEITLSEIRKVIDTAGKARPRERAKYLLTEGKLLTIIDPSNTSKLRSVMARYCNAMSLTHISDHNESDITRFYYNEAFSLEENYRSNAPQVALYLLTHCCTSNELINMSTNSVSVDDALKKFLSSDFEPKKWESILSMFLYNREISAQITSKLYSNDNFKEQSLEALKYFGVKDLNYPIKKDDFVEAWNRVRDCRIRDYKKIEAQIKSICSSCTIDEVINNLVSLRDLKQDWMTSLDKLRIDYLSINIVPDLQTYIKSSGYRNKEANKNIVNGLILQLIDEIKDGPTKLSYELILPLLNKINELMLNSFNEIIKMSAPKIQIKLLSSETVINNGDEVSIQVLISNHKDSSPIKEVYVDIENTETILTLEGSDISYNAIDGGEDQIFKLKIKVGKDIIEKKAVALNVLCKYKSGNEQLECSNLQTLRLYSPLEYCPIDNPYASLADGGPVSVESKMFYGREEFLSNISDAIIKSPSKQIIIYGQKRCGKSSVMLHLKKKLLETGKTFCIFFSIGDIINNLSEATFYHKILSTIQEELEMLEFDGVYSHIPSFNIPSIREFKMEDEDNPLNTFTKYLIRFKKICKQTQGWEDKNLVVMIDEFTYIYTEIKKGNISPSIMKQWKAVTQNERAQFSVVLVGQDVVPSFKKEDYARNAFGVIQDIRLTYLKENPARDLIEKPILDKNGNSRYIGNAVSKIIEYTSRNPYYIQIFCARLVEYMNANKSISVTEADVVDVANSFVIGSDALVEDKFDNLIRAGETEDLQEFPEVDILKILKHISLNSKNIGFCSRNDINVLSDKEREDNILQNLVDREVLEVRGENNYKIQVKLFQEWLLNH